MKKIFGQISIGTILLVALIHLSWAASLVFTNVGLGSTAVAGVHNVIGNFPVLVGVLIAASSMALVGIWNKKIPSKIRTLLFTPQQILLLFSAYEILVAVVSQHYADGVFRPFAFILTDQLPVLWLALMHTLGLVFFSDDDDL